MGCEPFKTEGGFGIICSRGRRPQACTVTFCGKPSVALCDYPVERKGIKGTCDSPMCQKHRHPVLGEKDKDWCEAHFNIHQMEQEAVNADANREMGLPEDVDWGNK